VLQKANGSIALCPATKRREHRPMRDDRDVGVRCVAAARAACTAAENRSRAAFRLSRPMTTSAGRAKKVRIASCSSSSPTNP